MLIFDHVEGTLLGRLGAAREPVEVQLDGTCGGSLSLGAWTDRRQAPKRDQPRVSVLTQEVVGGEVVGIPHLQREARGNLVLCLVPGEHGLLLGDDDLLLGHEIVEGVDEAPVEVALSCQGVVVHVRVLLVLLLPLQPPAGRAAQDRL